MRELIKNNIPFFMIMIAALLFATASYMHTGNTVYYPLMLGVAFMICAMFYAIEKAIRE